MSRVSHPKSEDRAVTGSDRRIGTGAVPLLRLILTALCLLLLGTLVFRDFVFGDKVLLFKEVGSDSINDYFASFAHLSDYVRHCGLPSWSFYVGMGQSLSYLSGYLILDPVVWLPKATIPYALVFQHLAKILVTGLLFMRFLQLRDLNFRASLAGSLFLSFSAYMCLGSCWIVFADEVVCLTFTLFAIEMAARRGRWIFVPIAVALVSLITVFHLHLCAVLLSFYLPFRLIELYGWKPASVFRICAQVGGIAFLGIGLAGVICLDSARAILQSPRGSGAIANEYWAIPTVFQFESSSHYLTAVYRCFSNDILGTGKDFRGWQNYFEAPITYCGLLCLLILPQVFIGATRRQRVLYGLSLVLVTVLILFPWSRYLFWLFQGGYYRTLSLFFVFVVITQSMTAFARYIQGRTLNPILLGVTLCLLLCVLFLSIDKVGALIDPKLRQTAAFFLVLYAALLTAGQVLQRQGVASWIIIGLAAIELIHFDRITVSNHETVTKQELKQPVGFNDDTVQAVADLAHIDQSFFRIRKTWPSGPSAYPSHNDAMVFGYYSTASFSSFNNLNYVKFLMFVDAISPADAAVKSIWSSGLITYPLLSTFACEKYVLTKEPEPFKTAEYYEFVKRYGDAYLFRNRLFLPLGLTFRQYILEDVFRQLPASTKSVALFHAAVLADGDEAEKLGLTGLTIDGLNRRMIETSIPSAVEQRRESALTIHSFSQTHIEGMVTLSAKSILVLQTPFDDGWRVLVDGQPGPTMKVDGGLLGTALEAGTHSLRFHYRSPLLYAGGALTLLSLCALCWSQRKWPRIRLP